MTNDCMKISSDSFHSSPLLATVFGYITSFTLLRHICKLITLAKEMYLFWNYISNIFPEYICSLLVRLSRQRSKQVTLLQNYSRSGARPVVNSQTEAMFILHRTLCNRRRVDLLKHSPGSRFFTAAISQSFVVRLRLRGEPNKSQVECARADAPAVYSVYESQPCATVGR